METCWEEIKKIVTKTICTVQPELRLNYLKLSPDDPFNQGCFEILGFDIILDRKMKPYLLEVNHAPSFHADSSVDIKVKSGLIKDTVNLIKTSPGLRRYI